MNFAQQACSALADAIQAEVRLTRAPTIIYATPSDVADYPSVSIMPEDHHTTWYQDDEIGTDEDGNLLVGARAEIRVPAGAAMLDDGRSHLSIVGRDSCSGRIWAGCRLPPKREAVQGQITRLFTRDSMCPGILEVVIPRPRVGPHILPWTWTASFTLGDVHWTGEYAFAERLYAWLEFTLDMSLLVDRSDPLITRLIADMRYGSQQDSSASLTDSADNAERYYVTVDEDGDPVVDPIP